ncbi:MAG: 16S rRNA (guanine(527)-N(7))-methyltransferase RsmG [Oscillospiraceae bacterium]|jgi:16S rRNA (guanine527-N7)-methyltransferase|nr:16S rRNA (guanine(527)-N(7))-methyltransferase RsmG [Oscillospiraceae bacterium]
MIDRELLTAFLEEHFPDAEGQRLVEGFVRYEELLMEWNGKMNLTAIKDGREITVKHFIDSLTPALTGRIPKNGTFVDVGSGAGFPGVPLTMLYPELGTILVDSLGKRVRFLQELTVALGVTAECVHSRAEELGQTSYREQCDVVTARAVANLSVLCEYCLPLAKVGGVFLAMKGPEVEEELDAAGNALELLGGKVGEVYPFTLPDGSRRNIIAIEKIAPTPKKYPRDAKKMKNNPL